MPTRIAGTIAVLLAVSAALVACNGNGGAPVVGTPTRTYVEGVPGTWQRVNPIYAGANAVDGDLSRLVFSGLTRLGPDGAVLPDLAESWEVGDEGREYRFTLREGLTWHDGEPVTSADIAFTVEQIAHPDYRGDPVLAALWEPVRVLTPDPRTVIIELDQPYAAFLARATTVGILPRHLLGTIRPGQLYNAGFNSAPVGTGPYRVEELTSSVARLSAYDGYHLGRPGIERLELRFYPDLPSAIRVLGTEIDGVFVRHAASERSALTTVDQEAFHVDEPQRSSSTLLYLNNDRVPFDDPQVRRAINLAIDRETIVGTALGGLGVASASVFAPGTWAYEADADARDQDLETARGLLQDAGWELAAGTDVRVRDGTEFRFSIRTDDDPARVAVASAIAGDLQEIGIRATVASTSFAVLRRDFLQERQYDAALAEWEQGADPDPYFAWHSSQTGPGGLNLANFGDLVMDELIAEARSIADMDDRADLYRQLQQVWQETAPSVVIAYDEDVYIVDREIDRPPMGVLFDDAGRFADIQEWTK